MPRKSFTISSELRLQMICVPHSQLCRYDHIYVNIELFGETQKTKLMHPSFPIKSNDVFYFEKILWSPQTMEEAYQLLRESPVSIELRHLKSECSDSILLAYADMNALEMLLEGSQHHHQTVKVDKNIELKQTTFHCGPLPMMKFHIQSKIITSVTPVMDQLLQYYSDQCPCCKVIKCKRLHTCRGGHCITSKGDFYSCDCELHKSDSNTNHHCEVCHQDRTVLICDKCLEQLKTKKNESLKVHLTDFEEEIIDVPSEKFRPPFVVRKVDHNIVSRKPDAYDSQYNTIVRQQSQRKSSRTKNLQRLRSCSPVKGKSDDHSSPTRLACYGCLLTGDELRISCDACNLTSRGQLSNRNSDIIRPEPPILTTYREPVDQRPLYSIKKNNCSKCKKRPKTRFSQDDLLLTSSRPLYFLDGYQDMEKYFAPHSSHR